MIQYLNPEKLKIETAPDGTLRAEIRDDRCALHLDVFRAMPLSHPEEQIVLRDGGGAEIGIIETLAALAEPYRILLIEALRRRYFLPKIVKIHSIAERFGSSSWEVETDRGPITINTRAMHEALTELAPGRYLLRDTEENRFEIPDINALDPHSQSQFFGV